jgi:3-mercaptopyruvate sulfurtransferase SseA
MAAWPRFNDHIATHSWPLGRHQAATVDALALTVLGESDVALYDGSLQEWTSNPALPVEVG